MKVFSELRFSARGGNSLPTFRDNLSAPYAILTCQSHLQLTHEDGTDGRLLKSGSKTHQTDTCVAAGYLATRIPHKSMDVILCGFEILPLLSHTPNILLLPWQRLEMVSSHLYDYIYYYSLSNGKFMFFSPSFFNFLCMGVEIFPYFPIMLRSNASFIR